MNELALPKVINAAGHLSMLGGGVSPKGLAHGIAAAIEEAMTTSIDMARLKDEASARIAAATGGEAGCVTTGAAAGIALSVAASIAGLDPAKVHANSTAGPKVVLQAGHDIDFGAPVLQMVRLGGGNPVLAGTFDSITEADLEAALPDASAMLFIQSHHVHAENRLSLEASIRLARAAGTPLILDAAAEEDLRMYVAAGADLVIYSGGKALGGLSSSGFVAGRASLVAAVRAQDRGIGRPMKVGPEQILSVCLALDFYGSATHDDRLVLAALVEGTRNVHGAGFAIVTDEAGRPIRRLEVRTPRAAEVAHALRENSPPIYVRAHHVAEGRFLIDTRNLVVRDVPVIIAALARALR